MDMMNDTNGKGSGNGDKPRHAGLFTKGDPRINKNGRGKGKKTIPAMLKRLASLKDKEGKTALECVCLTLIDKAKKGDLGAIQLLYERMEGRPRQTIEMTNHEAEIGAYDDEQLEAYLVEQSRN